ncbi:MAG: GntR family transcriptional regulator [Hyphomicrobiaceae bacterium]
MSDKTTGRRAVPDRRTTLPARKTGVSVKAAPAKSKGGAPRSGLRLEGPEKAGKDAALPAPRDTSRSTKQLAYEAIRNAIIFCQMRPGSPINERELAARHRISRTPLREILFKLAHQRLVTLEPNKGAIVSPVDYGTARATYEVRLPLERATAALAAASAGEADVAALRGIVERLRDLRARQEIAAFIETDRLFHAELARIAGNPLLIELLEDLHNTNLRFWYLNRNTVYDGVLDVENLSRVADAVARHDSREAANAMADHVMAYVAAAERFLSGWVGVVDNAFR